MTWQPPQQPEYRPMPGPPGYPPQPPQPQRTPKRPWWSRGWVLPTAAVLALLIGIGIGTGGASQGPKPAAKNIPGPTVTVATTVSATVTATAAGPTTTVTTTPVVTKVIATHTKTVRVTFTPKPVHEFTDGTYRVGPDIPAGLYHTAGGSDCYWERMSSLSGDLDSILANDNITGPTTVQVKSSDKAFQVDGGCTWSKVT
jgi:hypothetical protein